MSHYNPNVATVAGIEWPASRVVQQPIPSFGPLGKVLGYRFISTATETIEKLGAFLRATSAGPGGNAFVGVDIYDNTTDPIWAHDDLHTVIKSPGANRDTNASYQQCSPLGTCAAIDSTAYTFVDDVLLPDDDGITGTTDGLTFTAPNSEFHDFTFDVDGVTTFDGDTGASGASLSGKRVINVQVLLRINAPDGAFVRGRLMGDRSVAQAVTTDPSPSGTIETFKTYLFQWYRNPLTNKQWTLDDIANINAGVYGFGFGVACTTGKSATVTSVQLQIITVPERRVATGYAHVPLHVDFPGVAPHGNWVAITLADPNDNSTATWSKTNAKHYQVLFTVMNGTVEMPTLDAAFTDEHAADEYSSWNGCITPASDAGPTGRTTLYHWAPGIYLQQDSGAILSTDSQVYVQTIGIDIDTDNSARQDFPSLTGDYGIASILCRTTPDAVTIQEGFIFPIDDPTIPDRDRVPNEPLQLTIQLTADDSVLLGPVDIDVADVPDDGKWHKFVVRFNSSTVLTADPVYITISSATPTDRSWHIMGLSTRPLGASETTPYTTVAVQSYGGTAETGYTQETVFLVSDTTLDLVTTFGTVPDPPDNAVAVAATIPNQLALSGPGAVPTIGYAALTWDSTSLAGSFLHYLIQRHETDGWKTIAVITDEDQNFFNDFELRRNTDTSYRIHVNRTDGKFSDWTNFNTVSVPLDCGVLTFASNLDPDTAYAAQVISPYQWTRSETDRVVTVVLEGRDTPVAFRPPEAGADVFTRTLIVAAAQTPEILAGSVDGGRSVFEPLRAIMHNMIVPYVTVTDEFGWRWYTAPKITNLEETEPVGSYHADVAFVEVTLVPSVVNTDTPWSP